jgi:hypothetical protein
MPLMERERYGSGRLDDGVFCSLRCYAEFHGPRHAGTDDEGHDD